MEKCNSPISAQLVIPASFAECLTYEKQILWLKKEIDSLSGGGDPDTIVELQRRVTTLESNYNELQRQINNLPIDTIENELNTISADIQLIKNSLDTKQDVLTFDNEPTAGSSNPVTSEGILEAIHNEGMRVEQLINGKVDKETFNEAINNIINNYVTTGNLTEALTSYAKLSDIADMATKTELANYATKSEIEGLVTNEELSAAIADLATKTELSHKQDKLIFDNAPTEGSNNVLTSGTIYKALQNVTPTGKVDDTVTDTSSNPVKSSGIYTFVKAEEENLATKNDIAGFITEDALTDYAKKTELGSYVTKNELGSYATKTELGSYATKTDISDMATKTELTDYATKTDISDMATKTELADYAKTEDLGVYATKAELGKYVKDEELATELTNYATKTELGKKQNTLTFDNTPTVGSTNPVTSDGIKKAIDAISSVAVDSTVSQSSENPVSSNGIYNFVLDQMGDLVTTEQLATKQDKLTFDQSPAAGSNNVVTSDGIYSAIQTATQDVVKTSELSNYATKTDISDMVTKSELGNYATKIELEDYATNANLANYATKSEISGLATKVELSTYATKAELANKQDTLVFDDVPTASSQNPVRSSGIYNAINTATTDMLTRTEANDLFLNKSETTQFIQRKKHILNNDIIKDGANINFGTYETDLSIEKGNLSLSKVFVEYDRDVYNENGMWVFDCNLIVLLTTNVGFNLPSSIDKIIIDRITTNQNKQMILKIKECTLEIFGISSKGPKYCIYYSASDSIYYGEDYTNKYYFADLKKFQGVGNFTLLSNNTHYIKVKCPYKLVSSNQFTVDTSFI